MSVWIIDHAPSAKAVLLLAHGAGAAMDSPFMTAIAQGLAQRQISVVRFEFPYMARRREDGGKRPPDRMPVLQHAFIDQAQAVRQQFPDLPVMIGGKSMGGRVAAMVAPQIAPNAVFCLGYPFYPTGKPETLTPDAPRLAPLLAAPCPIWVIQGERDTLGNRENVAPLPLPPAVTTVWITDGDHSLKPRKSLGFSYDAALELAISAMASGMEAVLR